MSLALVVRDETPAGAVLAELSLVVPASTITARELIRSRVYHEVDDYNRRRPKEFRGLVEPTDAEKTLTGYRLRQFRRIDSEEQYQRALAGFQKNQVLILVDDRQVESLDETVELRPTTKVSFLRLVPLVGG